MPSIFSIYEVEEQTGISAYTIRYYDKCGFFPTLLRDKAKARCFRSADIEQLRLVDALRKSGLSIDDIKRFVELQQSKNSNSYVKSLLENRMDAIKQEQKKLQAAYDFIREYTERHIDI